MNISRWGWRTGEGIKDPVTQEVKAVLEHELGVGPLMEQGTDDQMRAKLLINKL